MTAPATDSRPGGLLAWQWSLYPGAHRTRANLLTHALTAPLFIAGTVALVASPFARNLWLGALGFGTMLAVIAIQRGSHQSESVAPSTFRGPLDIAQRFLAEQWFTFPRYILTGGFARAWRATAETFPR